MSTATRAHTRLPCDLPAKITFDGDGAKHTRSALVSNISTAGVQILSPSFVATGQLVQLSFQLPGQKNIFSSQGEIVRVESLQKKAVPYPYALGAKLLHQESRQEKRIFNFISSHATLASARFLLGSLLLFLGALSGARALLHLFFSTQGIPAADLIGSHLAFFWGWVTNPAYSILFAAGFIFSGVFCFFNRPTFVIQGTFWCLAGALTSLLRIYAKKDFFILSEVPKWIWPSEVFLLIIQGTLFAGILIVWLKLKRIKKTLSPSKPFSNRPTFTIL